MKLNWVVFVLSALIHRCDASPTFQKRDDDAPIDIIDAQLLSWQSTDAVRLIINIICFLAIIQVGVFTFIVFVKVVCARSDLKPRITRQITVGLFFFFMRCLLILPVCTLATSWWTEIPEGSIETVSFYAVWVISIVWTLLTVLQFVKFMISVPKLYQGSSTQTKTLSDDVELSLDASLVELPVIHTILVVKSLSKQFFKQSLKSVLSSAYPKSLMNVVVVFDRNSLVHSKGFLKFVGIDEIEHGRTYYCVVDGITISFIWSQNSNDRYIHLEALNVIERKWVQHPQKLAQSLLIIINSGMSIQKEAMLFGSNTLILQRDTAAVSGWISILNQDKALKRNLIYDTDSVHTLLSSLVYSHTGCFTDLQDSCTFVRYKSIKAIESEYFKRNVEKDIYDHHLMNLNPSRYMAMLLIERFGPTCVQFDARIQTTRRIDNLTKFKNHWTNESWSTVSSQCRMLLKYRLNMEYFVILPTIFWRVSTDHASLSLSVAYLITIFSGNMPITPILAIMCVGVLRILMVLMLCCSMNRPGLGLFASFYLNRLRPLFRTCVLIASAFIGLKVSDMEVIVDESSSINGEETIRPPTPLKQPVNAQSNSRDTYYPNGEKHDVSGGNHSREIHLGLQKSEWKHWSERPFSANKVSIDWTKAVWMNK